MATAIASEIISRHYAGVDLGTIVSSLFDDAPFFRKDHKLHLIFQRVDANTLRIEGTHSFNLTHSQLFPRQKHFDIYTDLGTSSAEGGFVFVSEPGGMLSGDTLRPEYAKRLGHKDYFSKTYLLLPEVAFPFVFKTVRFLRNNDRIIWTVQDMADHFDVTIRNEVKGCEIEIKINHHREREVLRSVQRTPRQENGYEDIRFVIDSIVLPYQGFEVSWNVRQEDIPVQ